MKKSVILVLMLSLVLSLSIFSESEYLPESGIVSLKLREISSDDGVNWLLNSWKNSDRESSLRKFVRTIQFDTMGVSILPSQPGGGRELLLAINAANGFELTNLKKVIQTRTSSDILKQKYQSHTIYYNDVPAEYNAVAAVGNYVLIGTSVTAIEKAIGEDAFTENSQYKDAAGKLSADEDVILFGSNSSGQFAEFLDPLQDKWRLTLLLSADSLEWIGSSFDVVESNTIKGKIIFKSKDSSGVDDVADDASFIGEAFKRKFMAENIEYSSRVTVDGTYVTLSFDCTGLEPLWLKLFEDGAMSVISP